VQRRSSWRPTTTSPACSSRRGSRSSNRSRASGRNPFTGQVLAGAAWDAGSASTSQAPPPSSDDRPTPRTNGVSIWIDDGAKTVDPALPPASEALQRLEELAPRRLRALPHVVTAGITGIELEALSFVLLKESKPPARVVETLDGDGFVGALPASAVLPLGALDDAELEAVLHEWSARVRGLADGAFALRGLRELARVAAARDGHVLTHMPA
jgi:hypothetical protein